ncbi:TraR/DksA family transcriptional regulator [Geoalkalibacter halelectricus]|uniref:TraR/DksA family transcriptional regulator n=1 Tax=Geoalkalibacter halelectricus TaxID=2847045 RepID=UPI003D1921CF
MADEIDRAQAHNERHQEIALAAWRARQRGGSGRRHCLDCEEEIPMKRRTANPQAVRCVDCQGALEHRGGAR